MDYIEGVDMLLTTSEHCIDTSRAYLKPSWNCAVSRMIASSSACESFFVVDPEFAQISFAARQICVL